MALLRLLMTQITMMAMMMTARAATTGTMRLRLVRKAMIWVSRSPTPERMLSFGSSRAGARVPVNRQVLMASLPAGSKLDPVADRKCERAAVEVAKEEGVHEEGLFRH